MGFDYVEGVQCPDAFPEEQVITIYYICVYIYIFIYIYILQRLCPPRERRSGGDGVQIWPVRKLVGLQKKRYLRIR